MPGIETDSPVEGPDTGNPGIPIKSPPVLGRRNFKYLAALKGAVAGKKMAKELRVVRLIEPELCKRCNFADVADVDTSDGTTQRMIYCRRGDCDNWDTTGAERAKRMRFLPER